jgi:hypothetical protein
MQAQDLHRHPIHQIIYQEHRPMKEFIKHTPQDADSVNFPEDEENTKQGNKLRKLVNSPLPHIRE